jgi:hypothetical protein
MQIAPPRVGTELFGRAAAPTMMALLLLVALPSLAHANDDAGHPSDLWCPRYHQIQGHYDPSGPIMMADGTW